MNGRNQNSRLSRLEAQQPVPDKTAWAEILGNGAAFLCFPDGRRVEVPGSDIPEGVKVYSIISPDDWDKDL